MIDPASISSQVLSVRAVFIAGAEECCVAVAEGEAPKGVDPALMRDPLVNLRGDDRGTVRPVGPHRLKADATKTRRRPKQ
jgi:hypothetical protein